MEFEHELDSVLPADLPNRSRAIQGSARHLEMIVEANRMFNLTRITGPREAAIKHVLDSVLPWRLFEHAKHALDAGSGAGFPGIPLSLVLPHVRFTLAESIGKKARFIESAVKALALENVQVLNGRAEELLKTARVDAVTARAMAPLAKAVGLFAPAIRKGSKAILYKGPDAESEIADAEGELRRLKLRARVVHTYVLPNDAGTRTMVEVVSRPWRGSNK